MGAAVRVSFRKVIDVKEVPGVPEGRKPSFFERYLYWRQCCLSSASVFGLLFVICALAADIIRIRNMDDQFEQFPSEIREHFKYYVYLTFAASALNTCLTIVVVFMLWAACCFQANFKVSLDKERQAWVMLIIWPFIPFLIIPFGSSLRTKLVQRDICAVTLLGLLKSSITRGMMAEAARRVGENELAVVALYPPPAYGSDGWSSWQGLHWCMERHSEWQAVLFSSEWVKSAYTGFKDPRLTLPFPGTSMHQGVIPECLRVMMGVFGGLVDPGMRFCYDDFLMKAEAIKDAFGALKAKVKGKEKDSLLALRNHSNGLSLAMINGHGTVHLQAGAWRQTDWRPAGGTTYIRRVQQDRPHSLGVRLGVVRDHGGVQADQGGASVGFVQALTDSFARRTAAPPTQAAGTEPHPSLLEAEHNTPDKDNPLGVVTKIGLQAVCYTFRGAMGLLRVSRLTSIGAQQMVGLFAAAKAVSLLAMSIFSVVDGLVAGVVNAKLVVPSASLPGHILHVAVVTSLPPIFLVLAILSQVTAHILFSIGVSCLALWRGLDLKRAYTMTDTAHPKAAMERFEKLTAWQGYTALLGMFFILLYFAHMFWVWRDGNIHMGVGLPSMLQNVKLSNLLDPAANVAMLSKMLLVRVMTNLVTTDLVLEAMFDSADDELKGAGCEGEDILNGYRRLFGKKPIKMQRGSVESPGAAPGEDAAPAAPELPPKPPPIFFQVRVEKGGATPKLGIVCGVKEDYLEVEEISGGAFGAWNQQNPLQQVLVYDHIVQVNGVSGDGESIRSKLRDEGILEVQIRREFKS